MILRLDGLTTYAGLSIAMADVVGRVDGSALQALNVLADDAVFVFLLTIGTSAFLLGAAAAVFGTAVLPRWLGWSAVVFAVVGAIPSHVLGGTLDHIGLFAFAGLGAWTLIVSVMLASKAATALRTMQKMYERINAHEVDGFCEYLADDFVEHEMAPGLAPTREGVRQFFTI